MEMGKKCLDEYHKDRVVMDSRSRVLSCPARKWDAGLKI